ncbi:MAG: hypothetical protein WCT46_02555 [Candidatus Gracilibacteria bacterium]|jgi:hypothetical protein
MIELVAGQKRLEEMDNAELADLAGTTEEEGLQLLFSTHESDLVKHSLLQNPTLHETIRIALEAQNVK